MYMICMCEMFEQEPIEREIIQTMNVFRVSFVDCSSVYVGSFPPSNIII